MWRRFADDTKLFRRIATHEDSMLVRQDLTSVCAWSGKNHLVFNHMESAVVMFRQRSNNDSQSPEYSLSGSTLDIKQLQKDLGVYIHI